MYLTKSYLKTLIKECLNEQKNKNPWYQKHLDATAFLNKKERALIDSEYDEEAMSPIKCGMCNKKTAWYRPTISSYQCINCKSVLNRNRKWVK